MVILNNKIVFLKKSCCSIDATFNNGRCGRLINHSRLKPNCRIVKTTIGENPHLYFEAISEIEVEEELVYDYGEK